MTAEGTVGLSPEKVLLAIGTLDNKKNSIWQGAIAKSLCNGQVVTTEMIEPCIVELQKKHLIIRYYGHKKLRNTIPLPVIILTSEGYKMIDKLKR